MLAWIVWTLEIENGGNDKNIFDKEWEQKIPMGFKLGFHPF